MNGQPSSLSTLFYVMGPSGAGKDSLLRYVRSHIAHEPVLFAHRYITRPAHAGGENHIAVTPHEFERLQEAGAFTLHWKGNGLCYGIGREVDTWLSAGMNVVVNGSRAHLNEAVRRYPQLCPVLIDVTESVLAERLFARARESNTAIIERLARHRALPPVDHPELVVIRNDGPLEHAGDLLLQRITQRPSEAIAVPAPVCPSLAGRDA